MPGDLVGFKAQAAQSTDINLAALESPFGEAWTALVDARPVACAGLVEVWEGRAYAWALLAEDAGPHMLAVTREIRSRIALAPFRRIEMAVAAGFTAGCRWAGMLGFICETPQPMRAYLPDGRDAWLYARVRDGSSTTGLDVQQLPGSCCGGDPGRRRDPEGASRRG